VTTNGPAPVTRINSWRLLLGNPVTAVSAAVLAAVAGIAVGADWLVPYGINDVDVPSALQSPSGAHWFGTDELGRDVLSRVLVAVQASMEVAVVSVGFALVVGVTIGVIAGYRGGWGRHGVHACRRRHVRVPRAATSRWRSWRSSDPG